MAVAGLGGLRPPRFFLSFLKKPPFLINARPIFILNNRQYAASIASSAIRNPDVLLAGCTHFGEQASVRKVAVPNVVEVLLVLLSENVGVSNISPNPELELPRDNLLKSLLGRNATRILREYVADCCRGSAWCARTRTYRSSIDVASRSCRFFGRRSGGNSEGEGRLKIVGTRSTRIAVAQCQRRIETERAAGRTIDRLDVDVGGFRDTEDIA